MFVPERDFPEKAFGTHGGFNTQKLLQSFTHKHPLLAEASIHTGTFTPRSFYTPTEDVIYM